jgi:hypothetical protein
VIFQNPLKWCGLSNLGQLWLKAFPHTPSSLFASGGVGVVSVDGQQFFGKLNVLRHKFQVGGIKF